MHISIHYINTFLKIDMQTKISTQEQVSRLKVGNIIKRFPSCGQPEELFDSQKVGLIDIFVIKSIHPYNNMIGLVMTGASICLFASPVDIGRLFIHKDNLVKQNIWWF